MPIYLDHAATSPLRPQARDAWLAAHDSLGNPSSIHASGQQARMRLETAREAIARHLGAEPIEVVLTSGGTESINLAIKGIYWQRQRSGAGRRILTTAAEHHATLDAIKWLTEYQGAEVGFIDVDETGCIRLDHLERELSAGDVALVTSLHANNEVGTVQPVRAVCSLAARFGVPSHIDAVSSLGSLPVSLHEFGASAVSVSAHKVGGPVGVGALAVGRNVSVDALLHGGGQQRGMRSGTLDVAGAASFAAALDAAADDAVVARLRQLRDLCIHELRAAVPDAVLLGADAAAELNDNGVSVPARLPGNAHFLFPGAQGDSLLYLLDMAGVSVSTGSACQAGIPEPSHVVRAMGGDADAAKSVLRITLGWDTREEDVRALVEALPDAYARARRAGFSNR